MRQLLFYRVMRLQRQQKSLSPAVTFLGGWGSANFDHMGLWGLPPEYFCTLDAEQLCAAANAQGLSAAFEDCPNSPHALTISWPDS